MHRNLSYATRPQEPGIAPNGDIRHYPHSSVPQTPMSTTLNHTLPKMQTIVYND